jgi:hypothetical protein
MLEVAHDPFDRVFHAVEAFECLVAFDRAVEEDAPEPGILRGIDQFLFADGGDHALGRRRVEHLVVARCEEPIAQAHRFQLLARVVAVEQIEYVEITHYTPAPFDRVCADFSATSCRSNGVSLTKILRSILRTLHEPGLTPSVRRHSALHGACHTPASTPEFREFDRSCPQRSQGRAPRAAPPPSADSRPLIWRKV